MPLKIVYKHGVYVCAYNFIGKYAKNGNALRESPNLKDFNLLNKKKKKSFVHSPKMYWIQKLNIKDITVEHEFAFPKKLKYCAVCHSAYSSAAW